MTDTRSFSLSRLPALATVGIFLVVVVIGFAIFAPNFLTLNNASTIVITASVIMLASLGQLLVVISGGFDLSIGGVLPLSAVTFANLTTAGVPMIAAMAVCLAVGILVGLVHTYFIVHLKINPLITTLATMSITAGLAFTLANGQTLTVPAEAGVLGDRAISTVPWHVFLMIALVIVMHLLLSHTVLGRRIYMVGGNPEAARLAGVRVTVIGGSVYVFSGFFAAMAGIVTASQLLAASGAMGATTTMQSLAAVVLGGAALTGGRGSVPGAVIGVLLLGVIANGMSILHVPSFYQQVVTGLVLLAAVTLSRIQERARRAA
ncbi:ABC transporter permease [Herbiconiux sp. KACC 21604]|uniref:ABC transporter permease n=1 Tax=unclassified Herbiconiux TaxID=2618217 RepID=UPI001492B930|nr:ABC transporter permease [Herbiconiux sp. SALV-R1]QJU52811.1 ABC transporter permease [Herbiconiux sp. SALV-R1]WPO87723.1 ABC transporter permease [Herbiconiux sp. KACC 21604]